MDDDKEMFGHAVSHLLCVPTMPKTPQADDLLAHLTYREITGYDDYDGFYDGYPALDPYTEQPEINFCGLLFVKDTDEFDSRVFAVDHGTVCCIRI